LDCVEDEAVEDNLCQENNIDVFPGGKSECWEQCILTPTLPDLNVLENIVKRHVEVFFQPYDKEELRVDPLVLSVDSNAHFNM